MSSSASSPNQRADAARNRAKLLRAAREALVDGADLSMADVARRAGVGMATLYRNYPSRRELLEELFADQVDEVCQAARRHPADAPEALESWLRRFIRFLPSKHRLAGELLRQSDRDDELLRSSRQKILAAGRPLLAAAQQAGRVRADLSLEQILDLLIAVALIEGPPEYTDPLLSTTLRGLWLPPAVVG